MKSAEDIANEIIESRTDRKLAYAYRTKGGSWIAKRRGKIVTRAASFILLEKRVLALGFDGTVEV